MTQFAGEENMSGHEVRGLTYQQQMIETQIAIQGGTKEEGERRASKWRRRC
jgi:hypothetical protein